MIDIFALEFIWFVIFIILVTGYVILDGFDLGVGMVHLFSKSDEERRLMLNTIGPVWDGNEVWLVTAGGALFAGFPPIYATICSAFYFPVILLLTGLIFRAVAIEFRSKQPMPSWRWSWDILFSFASFMIAFGLGFIMGNLIRGIPLDAEREFMGSFSDLTHPYVFLIAFFSVSLFFMHGTLFVLMKTEGALHEKMRKVLKPAMLVFIVLYAMSTISTFIYMPHMTEAILERPVFFIVALINMLVIANIPRLISLGRDAKAFICSCLNMVCLMTLYAIGTYPHVVRAINDPTGLSLNIYNSASSLMTLKILLLIAVIGMPMVLAYTFAVYWIFHGKVKLHDTSY